MFCPRCHEARMAERQRDGIVIDVCPECRGVWLDRGELDRLLAKAKHRDEEHLERVDYEDDDERSEDHERRRGESDGPPHRRRRRGVFDFFGEIFD